MEILYAHAPTKVQLNYLNKTGQWSGATFPGLEDADLQQILESSPVASFGRGKETVTDKSYHDACALDPEKFTTSFQLSDTDILGEVRLLLVPDVLNIRAELYKMNIYTGPTGCFKAHVDTPRGGKMFGSLVVCLPSQFTGGVLVTRHNGQQVTYDWSSPGDGPIQNIRWAAFFSDVEHEILEVTEGHRVTLTYNLYYDEISTVSTVDVTNSPFYYNLKTALDHPHFLRDGGVLGFACQHSYVFEKFNKAQSEEELRQLERQQLDRQWLELTKLTRQQLELRQMQAKLSGTNLPPKERAKLQEQASSTITLKDLTDQEIMLQTEIKELDAKVVNLHEAMKTFRYNIPVEHLLKGSDRTVMLAAMSLGLGVEVKPIVKDDEVGCYDSKYFVGDQFKFKSSDHIDGDSRDTWIKFLQDEGFDDVSHIIWCQKFKHWQPAVAALVYGNIDTCSIHEGNDYSLEVCYQAAAILVTVPAWSERHHNTAPPDEPVQLPQTGEDKD